MEETEVVEEENEEEEERRRRRKEKEKEEKKKQEERSFQHGTEEKTAEEETKYEIKEPEKEEKRKTEEKIKAEPIEVTVPKPLKPLKAIKLEIKIYRPVKNEEEAQSEEKREESEEKEEGEQGVTAESEKEEEKIENLMDMLFKNPDGGSVSEGISEGDGRPIVIFFDDEKYEEYISALKELLKWEYRIIKGGAPDFKNIHNIRRLLREADWIRAGGNLVEIRLKKEDWEIKNKEKLDELKSRFGELFSQSFGFLLFRYYPQMLRDEDTHRIRMLNIRHNEIDEKDTDKLLKMIFAFVPVSESGDFSARFMDARDRYERELEKLTKDMTLEFAVNPNAGENESPEHFRIKLFVVKYLRQMLIEQGKISKDIDHEELKKRIETEASLSKGTIIADVFLRDKREVFEVETLYATESKNQSWEKKIQHTIEKYKGCYEVDKINVILENLTAMMHIDELIKLKRILEKWGEKNGKKVEFYVLNFEENRLVPIDDLYRQYLEIRRPVPFE